MGSEMCIRDRVLTENGIEEEGTHTELMKKDGIYAGLYRMQFAEEEV